MSRRGRPPDEDGPASHPTIAGDAEVERIHAVYDAYGASAGRRRAWAPDNAGNRRNHEAFLAAARAALDAAGTAPGDGRHLLDIGCGAGGVLAGLRGGAGAGSLHGVDLLEDRIAAARLALPGADLRVADARALPYPDASMAAVVLVTVLSSVLERAQRRRIAAEALRVLVPGGTVLCYDMRAPNPANPAVRAMTRRELGRLFPGCPRSSVALTLVPQLARRLGPLTDPLYGPLAALPPLRTHLLTTVRRPG